VEVRRIDPGRRRGGVATGSLGAGASRALTGTALRKPCFHDGTDPDGPASFGPVGGAGGAGGRSGLGTADFYANSYAFPVGLQCCGAIVGRMRVHKGRAVAIAILCAVAATVAVWSGPLAAASQDLHSGAATVQVGTSVHHGR
jgi:hypothetical protein